MVQLFMTFRKVFFFSSAFGLLLVCSATGGQVKSSSPNVLRMVAVGDIMSHQTQIDSAYDKSCDCWDFSGVFEEIAPMISEADLAVGNLETTLPGDPKQYTGYPQFGAPDSLAKAIRDAGFDVLSTANNHSCDKGKVGVVRTITVLEELGLKHLGTYRTREEYEKNRILKMQVGDFDLVFLDYTYGTNGLEIPNGTVVNLIDKTKISEDITFAKKSKPDGIIVMYHFGTEYLREPDSFQKEIVDFTLEAGADIVLGGHPHSLQRFGKKTIKDRFGIEKERFFIYSLGNFISGQDRRYVDGGIVLNFSLSKETGKLSIIDIFYEPIWVYIDRTGSKGPKFRLVPVRKYLKNDQPRKLPEAAFQRMLQFYKDTIEVLGTPGPK
ncbi:bacterial capsule synthesis protein [Leptospira inadai serovar Lyme str. 10]|uniref:Bacterial capsule synthesis protein n=2 Tax=Leptospira inadai serovar Lyme TaxID=293084 RepID=V6H811_9LEPT|nr:CapA family protein [Leptospira inadai]EQA34931.1 bacterial capsule synthesis protein [Leptospira inadai serovar Lyme str. 10]